MKRIRFKSLLLTTLAAALFVGCGSVGNEGKNSALTFDDVRTVSISQEPVIEINASTIQTILAGSINAGKNPGDTDYKTAFGVKSYRVVYTTTDDKGADVNASGLVTIPVPSQAFLDYYASIGKSYSMSIVSDQHGTIFTDVEAPSTSNGGLTAFIGAIMQGQQPTSTPIPFLMSGVGGFITVQPDYIGYGASKGFHPYLLEQSSANATVDLIKSTVKFASDASLPFNGQIFLSGYSEGGYASMAAAKEIETNHPNMNLMGVAPMAGPYDLNVTGMGVLAAETMGRPDFIGGIVNSYASVYDFALTDIVNEPYATTLPTLYDAEHTSSEIQAELTESINEFFVPTYRGSYLTQDENPLKQKFIENSPLDWAPNAHINLYHCSNDEVISSQLSQIAYAKLTANGATDVNLTMITTVPDDTLPSVHAACGIQTYPAALVWFSQIRSGEIK